MSGFLAIAAGFTNSGNEETTTEIIDLESNQTCQDLGSLSFGFSGSVGEILDPNIFLVCGGNYSNACYQITKDQSQTFALMDEKRYHAASAVLNQGLWILGGKSGRSTTLNWNSTEIIYSDGTVRPGPQMVAARSGHTVTQINDQQYLLVGGNHNSYICKDTYIFNSQVSTWTRGPDLINERRSHSAGIITDQETNISYLMVSGGVPTTPTTELIDIEKLDQWFQGSDIHHGPIIDHTTISWQGNLIFIGGINVDTYDFVKRIYKLSLNKMEFRWTMMDQELKTPRKMFVARTLPLDLLTSCH